MGEEALPWNEKIPHRSVIPKPRAGSTQWAYESLITFQCPNWSGSRS
jgi:hypothetical protein